MKTHLEFLDVTPDDPTRKTKVFEVASKHDDSILGMIQWDGGWRQYVFEPCENCKWSWDCLSQLSDFIKKLMEMRKK